MLYEKIFPQTAVPYFSTSTPGKRSISAFNEPVQTPDQLLWDAFKKGDDMAFVKIYNNYSSLLFQYGCRFTNDQEMVRDCLHDFFIYLRNNKMGFGDISSIKQYLFKAFRRRIVQYLKKDKNRVAVSEPEDLSKLGVELSFESDYIIRQTNAEQMEKLKLALNALDKKERMAIYCFYFQGLSYEQIAILFKFSHVSSARRVMYRGLRQLRDFFG